MDTSNMLSLELLNTMMKADVVAIRGKAILKPAGGPSDKVFPPTHSVDETKVKSRYAFETRRINGNNIECVLLDSVQSQANRMEEALQNLWKAERIKIPVVAADFSQFPEVGIVTSLSAPHRISDALLRDSVIEEDSRKILFRLSTLGKSFTDATPKNATELFKVCPTALVFGLWDSTGPKGGLGSKFGRCLVSEIVGINVQKGVQTSSKIDPTGIVTVPVYRARSPNDGEPAWTTETLEAATEVSKRNSKELDFVKVGDNAKTMGKPSAINHSNIPPTITELTGGVTLDYAEHTVVLSIAGVRKLGFGGTHDQKVHAVLVALALLAVLGNEAAGHDLRSRCLLIPEQGKSLRLVEIDRRGNEKAIELDLDGAILLYIAAVEALPESLKLNIKSQAFATLQPSARLIQLIEKSRALSVAGADGEEV